MLDGENLDLKLIDFGESYHPEVAGKNINIQGALYLKDYFFELFEQV